MLRPRLKSGAFLVAARFPVLCYGKEDKPSCFLSLKPQADDLTDQGL